MKEIPGYNTACVTCEWILVVRHARLDYRVDRTIFSVRLIIDAHLQRYE